MITLKIAVRNIFRHRTRTIITLSTIVFGCVALIFAGGFFEDIFDQMRESYIQAHTGHIQIFHKGFSEKGVIEPYKYLIKNPDEVSDIVRTLKGVKFVTPRLTFSGLLSTGENTISFMGMGVDPAFEKAYPLKSNDLRQTTKSLTLGGVLVVSGKNLDPKDEFEVMLGKGLAASMGSRVGDGLVLLTNTTSGSVNALDVSVKGIFYTSSKAFDDIFIRLPIKTAQKLLYTDSVQSVVVMLDKTKHTAEVKRELENIFRAKKMDLEVKAWNEISDFYSKTVVLFNRLFLIIKIVIIVVVILSIFNTMNMAVLERVSEIGTIMAMGAKRKNVLKLFMYEGIALGVIGGAIGVVLGALVTYCISVIGIPMPPPPGATMSFLSTPKVVPSMLLFSFVLSVVTALISSLYPAYTASRLEIAEALRHK
ncbi:MAG TPA: FtsX-like permease family protein [Candidatus Omnitrophota bacterium]|nr:FtsX-like permease family protein [Candidatus Omnitrophota bacterium]HPT08011.1 FtsX-like permease family protein [Candidatus Omnitrophota bacterium]